MLFREIIAFLVRVTRNAWRRFGGGIVYFTNKPNVTPTNIVPQREISVFLSEISLMSNRLNVFGQYVTYLKVTFHKTSFKETRKLFCLWTLATRSFQQALLQTKGVGYPLQEIVIYIYTLHLVSVCRYPGFGHLAN